MMITETLGSVSGFGHTRALHACAAQHAMIGGDCTARVRSNV
jgi:hypothetical protein